MIKRYDKFIERCKYRTLETGVYTEKHHILPKCQGGSNDESNLINLTAREHFIAHKMLYRENKEVLELGKAFHCMCTVKNDNTHRRDYKITSRDFELSRVALSESMRGENNPMYGKDCSGKNNNMWGHRYTDEERQAQSERMKGKNT